MKTLNLPHRSEGFELKVVVTDAEARGIVAGPANFDKTSSIQCQYRGCTVKKKLTLPMMRSHIAWHILNKHISPDACGFCGAVPACDVQLISKGAGQKKVWHAAAPQCRYYYDFGLKSTVSELTPKKNKPKNPKDICTN